MSCHTSKEDMLLFTAVKPYSPEANVGLSSGHAFDNDCEDQALVPTEHCGLFRCQTWEGNVQVRPKLVLVGKYWCCPKCKSSYGEHAKD